jgi:hypothetical protein
MSFIGDAVSAKQQESVRVAFAKRSFFKYEYTEYRVPSTCIRARCARYMNYLVYYLCVLCTAGVEEAAFTRGLRPALIYTPD